MAQFPNSISIRVEFDTGIDLYDALSQAKKKAISLDVKYIIFDYFRGVTFRVSQFANINKMVTQFETIYNIALLQNSKSYNNAIKDVIIED